MALGFTGLMYSLVVLFATILLCAVLGKQDRRAFVDTILVLFIAVSLRLIGPTLVGWSTGEPNLLFREPDSDEARYVVLSNYYLVHPQDWLAELKLRTNTRSGAVFHALRLGAYDAEPFGLRLIAVCAAASGAVAAWTAARRRLGKASNWWSAFLFVAWPYACHHDAALVREPWLTFVLGWSILGAVASETQPVVRTILALVSGYLTYLLQPHASISVMLAFVGATLAPVGRRLPRHLRFTATGGGLLVVVLVAGMLASRHYYYDEDPTEVLEDLSGRRAGGSAMYTPRGAVSLPVLLVVNSIQYLFGVFFIPPTSSKRILGFLDVVFWLPLYIIVVIRLWRGFRTRFGYPEVYSVTAFTLYNLISMSYVTNISRAIRKRNAFGVMMLYLAANALSREPQDSILVSGATRGRRRQNINTRGGLMHWRTE